MASVREAWRWEIIIESFVLAFIGAYSAVSLAEQHRTAGMLKSKFVPQSAYLVLMSIAIGGGAIWCMHFVGMGAMTLENSSGQTIHARFDIGVTIVSLLTSIVCVYLGLYISSRDKMFTRDREEIFKMIIAEAKGESLKTVQNKWYVMRRALLSGVGPLLLGGCITGAGVCVMHYIGMTALVAEVDIHWDVGIVCASVIIAVIASTAAFWILFRLLALYPAIESLRLLSAFVAAIAVCGMHYTGMMAASYTSRSDTNRETSMGATIGQEDAVAVALVGGLVFNWAVNMTAQADLRGWVVYLHARVKEARKTMDKLKERYEFDDLICEFEKKRSKFCSSHEVTKETNAINPNSLDPKAIDPVSSNDKLQRAKSSRIHTGAMADEVLTFSQNLA